MENYIISAGVLHNLITGVIITALLIGFCVGFYIGKNQRGDF